ncbi:hypothetical protein PUNSTDRAFT_130306 [Punctularia strigosozonata HHB-11173 SS5]|uniref:uncharacterized protein n=1 Tax=Punctularia strigosozonata (strain HHB-11173) TaxID=741275 RepID=UPI0004416C89|nr:uncharacterized protein PUNSTDRAFT_130306 [Punctularia strigosozonata HHB-11173 SS5]EIN14682.1 hypothetical protein PUNSTDRAFT_130306 [Punctularia strigosozonata HHB-11173 SS5]
MTPSGAESSSDRPERSRNAQAQARHRAKRKAYVQNLEQTVSKLQSVLGVTADEAGNLPTPLVRIKELQEEILRLQCQNDGLRRQLEGCRCRTRRSAGWHSNDEFASATPHFNNELPAQMSRGGNTGDMFSSSYRSPTHELPNPIHATNARSATQYSPTIPVFHVPDTPLSPTSESPYSASKSPMPGMRPTTLASPVLSPPFSHVQPGSSVHSHSGIKVEDDFRAASHHHAQQSDASILPYPQIHPDMGYWHAYSAERHPIRT